MFALQGKVDIASPTQENVFRNDGTLIKAGGSNSTISAALTNSGLIEVSAGRLTVTGDISGRGIFKIEAGQTLEIDGTVESRQTVAFSTGKDRLILGEATTFGGRLSNFGAGDRLEFLGFDRTTTTLSYSENKAGTQGTLTIADATHHADIVLLGQYMAAGFHASSAGTGGTLVTYTPPPESGLQLAVVAGTQH